jgi:hypothetical protein
MVVPEELERCRLNIEAFDHIAAVDDGSDGISARTPQRLIGGAVPIAWPILAT